MAPPKQAPRRPRDRRQIRDFNFPLVKSTGSGAVEHPTCFLVMATNKHTPLLVLSSENVEQGAKLAWNQVSPVAESVSEPTVGRASGFLPSELCYKVMNIALDEYLQEAPYSNQHRKISRSRKGGVVYFPGQPKIAETFTIMIPISVKGNVHINGFDVKMGNHYQILQECTLEVPPDGRLVALIIDSIVL